MTGRLVPAPSLLTEPFWLGTRAHEVRIQRCPACHTHLFYPRYLCSHCGEGDLGWVRVSGRGEIFTYTVARRTTHPSFARYVPYVIAVVQLQEGPRLTTNVVEADPEMVEIGMAVEATFEDLDDVSLLHFRPVR